MDKQHEIDAAKAKAKAIVDAAKAKAKAIVDAAKSKATISIEKAKAKANKCIDDVKKNGRKQKGGTLTLTTNNKNEIVIDHSIKETDQSKKDADLEKLTGIEKRKGITGIQLINIDNDVLSKLLSIKILKNFIKPTDMAKFAVDMLTKYPSDPQQQVPEYIRAAQVDDPDFPVTFQTSVFKSFTMICNEKQSPSGALPEAPAALPKALGTIIEGGGRRSNNKPLIPPPTVYYDEQNIANLFTQISASTINKLHFIGVGKYIRPKKFKALSYDKSQHTASISNLTEHLKITANIGKYLLEYSPMKSTLKDLDISYNHSQIGEIHLYNAYFDITYLENFIHLEKLNLSHNMIGNKNTKQLGTILQSMTKLTHLNISHTQLNIIDRDFVNALKSMHQLTHLDISGNNCTLDDFILEMLISLVNLTYLDISGNTSTSIDIKKKMPKLKLIKGGQWRLV